MDLEGTAVISATSGDNELLDLFTRYNHDLWPVHLVAYALGVAAVGLLFARTRPRADRATAAILAALWLWLGIVFQGLYATDISQTLGLAYAALFVVEAYLIFRHGVSDRKLAFVRRNGLAGWVGWTALGYAMIVYPVLGALLGHGWPESPLLGMAPCPTTIMTFGLFLLAVPPLPHRLLTIPLVWAILAPPAAMGRGVYEDLGLLVVGVLATGLILVRDHRRGHLDRTAATSTVDGRTSGEDAALGPRDHRSPGTGPADRDSSHVR
jgi:hypothetical protein